MIYELNDTLNGERINLPKCGTVSKVWFSIGIGSSENLLINFGAERVRWFLEWPTRLCCGCHFDAKRWLGFLAMDFGDTAFASDVRGVATPLSRVSWIPACSYDMQQGMLRKGNHAQWDCKDEHKQHRKRICCTLTAASWNSAMTWRNIGRSAGLLSWKYELASIVWFTRLRMKSWNSKHVTSPELSTSISWNSRSSSDSLSVTWVRK